MKIKSMKTIRVVAAVIRQNGKIFATQRGYGEWKDGWEFPGGKIETGETPEAALKREIHLKNTFNIYNKQAHSIRKAAGLWKNH